MTRQTQLAAPKDRNATDMLVVTSEDRVNTTTSGLQTNPAVAALAGGGHVVAWVSFDEFGPRSIDTQLYTADGAEAGGETQATTLTLGTGELPVVAGLADGGYVLAWPYRLGTTANTTSQVRLQRFDAEGQPVDGPTTVASYTFDYMAHSYAIVGVPSVAPLDDGGWVVGWLQEFNDPLASPPHVETTFVQRFDSSGAPVGEPMAFAGNTPVEMLAGGGYTVGTQVFDASGDAVAQLSPDLAGVRDAAVDALAGGGFAVVALTQDNVLTLQLLDASGTPIGEPTPFANGSAESLPEVAALPEGGFVALWLAQPAPDAAAQLLAQRFDAEGVAQGEPLTISPPEGFSTSTTPRPPAVAVLADGSIALGWVASDAQGPDVFTAVLDEAFGGTASRDHLVGTAGDDILLGQGGRDHLQGLAGNDRLDGGPGADFMAGGAGDDRYLVDDAKDRILERAHGGKDTIVASVDLVLPRQVENLVLQGDAVSGTGNALDNLIVGNALDNILDGAGGNDTLQGEAGADLIVLGAAPGAGNVDTVLGFDAAEDRIALAAKAFQAIGAGPLPEEAFRAGTQALDADDRILFDAATGELAFDPDGDGAAPAVLLATLVGVVGEVGAADFVVQ